MQHTVRKSWLHKQNVKQENADQFRMRNGQLQKRK